jgi:integrase
VHRMIKRACKRADIDERASAHWLRHSHASHSLEAGCNFSVRDAGVWRLLSNHAGEVVAAVPWSCECDYYREVSAYIA